MKRIRNEKGLVPVIVMSVLVGGLIAAAVVQKVTLGGPKPTKAAIRKCAGEGTIQDKAFKAKVDSCKAMVKKMSYQDAVAYLQ